MSQISIAVNGRDYSIVCEDGQERHLTRLAEYIDRRIEELVESVGQIDVVVLRRRRGDRRHDVLAVAAAAVLGGAPYDRVDVGRCEPR